MSSSLRTLPASVALPTLFLLLTGCLASPAAWGWGKAEGPAWVASEQVLPMSAVDFPRPRSHEGGWLEYHGNAVDLVWNEAGQPGNACLVCHARADCVSCHSISRPRDHTNSWRTRTHGFEAGADRRECLICHRQDTCVRCHNETAPRNHRGNWTSEHCSSCHFGSGIAPANSCAVCHRIARH